MPNRYRRLGAGFLRGVRDVAVGVYRHDCLGLAAQIAYSALFSLFPFLLFLRALVAYFPGADRVGELLLAGLRDLVSKDSRLYQIVEQNVFKEVDATSSALLSVGIILTLWSASGAIMTLIKAVNQAYGLEETRSWQRRRLMASGLAIAGAVIIPAGVALLIFGSWIGDVIAREAGQGSVFHVMWVGLRWPVVSILLVIVVCGFFFFAPDRRQRWYSVLPGSFFAVGTIIGLSVGLSWFLSQSVFQVRWLTYGAIGTAIVLLFWAFIIGLMILFGGEINAAVKRTVDHHREARLPVNPESVQDGLLESPHDE